MGTISFKGDPDAYCLLAKSHTNRLEGLDLLAQPLRDGSWKDAPTAWMTGLSWGFFWNDPECQVAAIELRAELVASVLSGKLDDAAYAVLPGIFNLHHSAPLKEADAVAKWLLKQAGPNDVPVVADVVQHVVYDREGTLRRDCVPLVEWLLTHGSSELRSGRRSQLVAELVPLVVEHRDAELLAPAIRYVLYNEHKLKTDAHSVNTVEKLLPAIEQVITTSGSTAIVGDLVEALEPPALEAYLHRVLLDWAHVPRSRQDIVRRLTNGEIEPRDPVTTWMQAVAGPPVKGAFASAPVARSAAAGLHRQMIGYHNELPGNPIHPDRRGWGHAIARGFLDATDLLATRDAEDIRLLQNCAGHERRVMAGVHAAVKEAADASTDPHLDDVRTMLVSPGTDESVVFAALELLKGKRPGAPATKTTASIEHIIEAIECALVADGPLVCGFDFRQAVNGATRAKAEKLDG